MDTQQHFPRQLNQRVEILDHHSSGTVSATDNTAARTNDTSLSSVDHADENGHHPGHLIAAARQQRNWTQRELGERLGIGSSLVAKWEQGSRIPPYEWLVELDRVLGTELSRGAQPSRRRGPRPGIARQGMGRRPSREAVLVEISDEGISVFQVDHEVETIVLDLREFQHADPSDRVRRASELLLRSLELPRPLAERMVRRLADIAS